LNKEKMVLAFVSKRSAIELLGISDSTLKVWRLGKGDRPPKLTEGVHWIRYSEKAILYNSALLEDFIVNIANPEAHERAIANYLASLPSNKVPKKRA
jgi:hypothetical protein